MVARLSRDGYAVQVLTGSRPKVLTITGRIRSDSELLAIGSPPPRQAAVQGMPWHSDYM